MALAKEGTGSKPPATGRADVLQRLEAMVQAFRSDPALAAAERQQNEAQAAAQAARQRVTDAAAARRRVAIAINRPDLVDDEKRILQAIDQLAGARERSLGWSKSEMRAQLQKELQFVHDQMEGAAGLPGEKRLEAVSVDLRRQFRDAVGELDAAVGAESATREPVLVARDAVDRARRGALARCAQQARQLHIETAQLLEAALDVAREQNALLEAVQGRLFATFGQGFVEAIAWREFLNPLGHNASKLDTWKQQLRQLRTNAGA